MEKYIEKEDIYLVIAKSAMSKIQPLFSEDCDNNNTYIHNGREYREYDVPVFIVLSGLAHGYSLVDIFRQCVMQMQFRGFSPNPEKLNQIVDIVRKECQAEIDLVRETDKRSLSGESPVSIFNDIIDSLNQQA